jgi:hypothetical protein
MMRALAAALLVLALHAPSAGGSRATAGGRVVLEGCQDWYAPIPASAADVRRHVPDLDASRHRMVGEDAGIATLVVRVFACRSVSVPGSRPRPTLGAQFGVTIESPDGTGQVLGTDACCNWYTFFWVTDNPGLAGWLKQGTGFADKVRHVKRLVYRHQTDAGSLTATIHFAAGVPTPSPFTLDATAAAPTGPWPDQDIAPNWWAESGRGTVKIANDVPGFRPYHASGEVSTRAGTQMAALFHGETRHFGTPVSHGRWDRSVTTKSAGR